MEENEQKASVGLKILSFIIPIVGLIIFACNISSKPKYAKGCGIAALIGFIIEVVISIAFPMITALTISSSSSSVLNDMNVTSKAAEIFNSSFEVYEGNDVTGSKVRTLISTVKSNNINFEEHQIEIILDGTKQSNYANILMKNTYKVETLKDYEGYINKINITTKD